MIFKILEKSSRFIYKIEPESNLQGKLHLFWQDCREVLLWPWSHLHSLFQEKIPLESTSEVVRHRTWFITPNLHSTLVQHLFFRL